MEFNLKSTFFFLAMLTTGLSAGLFFAWTVSVIPGTKRVSDFSYLETMQSINKAILNPAFFIIFFGALIFLILSTYTQAKVAMDTKFWIILGSLGCYLLGTIGVTMLGNVPLNNALEAKTLNPLDLDSLKAIRLAYEDKWNRLNLIRTIFALVSFILLYIALFNSK